MPRRRCRLPRDDSGLAVNRIDLAGLLLTRGVLRRTPAGIATIEFALAHRSSQEEAESRRIVECEVPCIAVGEPAQLVEVARLGQGLTIRGFLAAKSLKTRALVLHVTEIEFAEGNENGF